MDNDEFDGGDNGSVGDGPDDPVSLETVSDGGSHKNVGGSQRLEGVLRALVNQRRRHVLYFLQDNEVSDLDELASHVVVVEQNIDPDTVTADQIGKVQRSLVHSDLPMLEEAALVEFDRRSEAVRYSHPPDLLELLLRLCATFDSPPDQ